MRAEQVDIMDKGAVVFSVQTVVVVVTILEYGGYGEKTMRDCM